MDDLESLKARLLLMADQGDFGRKLDPEDIRRQAVAAIEALTAERDTLRADNKAGICNRPDARWIRLDRFAEAEARAIAAETKLADTVEALENIRDSAHPDRPETYARATLIKLKE